MERIVIVGAGQASGWAVSTLRQNGFRVKFMWSLMKNRSSMSGHLCLNRSCLERLIMKACLFSADQIESFNIQWHKPAFATQLDRQHKQVILQDGKTLPYDKLLIATGSRARIPVKTWQFIPNVLTLRNVQDCEYLAERLEKANKVAVVGGGWIGLEIAATARKQGKQVHVLNMETGCVHVVSVQSFPVF